MRRFFAIILCLVVSASVLAATPHQKPSEINKAKVVIATAIRLLEWRLGIVPTSDGLTPPFPGPTKPMTCCK